jgi:hypothetical protein
MDSEELEFWTRVTDYERQYSSESFQGRSVPIALQLRRDADDMLADLSEWADVAGDTENPEDYIRWLQKVGIDITNRIDMVLGTSPSTEIAEHHIAVAYKVLREVARDALSRRGSTAQPL